MIAAGLAVLVLSPWAGVGAVWFAVAACSVLTYLVTRHCVKRARNDRAHYRRAWEVLAVAVFVKAGWEAAALVKPQPWSLTFWGKVSQEGLAAVGFIALTIAFYVVSFLALRQEQHAGYRNALRVDVLLIVSGLVSIQVLSIPVLRLIPGSGESLATLVGGLLWVGALPCLLIVQWRAPDFELSSAWASLQVAAGAEAVRTVLLSLPVDGVPRTATDWLVGPLGLASVVSFVAVGVAAVADRPPPVPRFVSEKLRPSMAAPAFAATCLAVAASLQIIVRDLLGVAPAATRGHAAVLLAFLIGFLTLILVRVYTDQSRSLRDMGQLRTKTVELGGLLDNINDAVATQNFDGRILFANRSFRELFGLRHETPHLPPLDSLVHPSDASLWREFCSRNLMGKRSAGFLRYRGLRADGVPLELETSIAPLSAGGSKELIM